MTALPIEVPRRLQGTSDVINAYNICLRIENTLQVAVDKGEGVGKNVIYIRILGYLLHHAPSDQGVQHVVNEIVSAEGDFALLEVGKNYFNHYIRPFLVNRSRILRSSYEESPPSFDTISEMTNRTFVASPQSHAAAKSNALIRDGYRCVVTKEYDLKSIRNNLELEQLAAMNPKLYPTTYTQCTHIFSESINYKISKDEKLGDAAKFWTIMEHFGYTSLPSDLNGPNIHRSENVITLGAEVHMRFDDLELWFVATPTRELSGICRIHDLRPPVNLPVPSPTYLEIHAACAKIGHLSGATEYIDRFYGEVEGSTVLAPDGASASLLEDAIFELQARAYQRAIIE
ncbi:hypothetical protein M413DRAFT_32196 [Hebeloma cylindrosporum]|uniref:HNH nuclease domain-containing protein n=1 Tax=Hebeloma cylindrosporum TaxID=76867 RepID=A0A0C3BUS3_HEBCY|nr:hypothetical protein M413DRAFT_32196 [Hebeloma cylindrosporum h7]